MAAGTYPVSTLQRRIGLVLSGLVVAFFVLDATMKLLQLPVVLQSTVQIGWPVESALPLGAVLLSATVLYILPRTSVLGAVLLTGYLGGAIATQARISAPWFSHILFGAYVGLAMWAGLYLRDRRLRDFLPWTSAASG